MAAALALGLKGYNVHVLEQSTDFKEIGAGIQLGPNVFRMFEVLNLAKPIKRSAVFPDALVMRDALSAQEITNIPVNTANFIKHFGFPYAVIYRPDLHKTLLKACKRLTNIQLIYRKKVIKAEQTAEQVLVVCEDKSSFEGIALIGADGLWSKVRDNIIGIEEPRVSGHIAYRAVLPMGNVPTDLQSNEVILWAGPKTHLVQYPLHSGKIMNLVAVFHSDKYEEGWDVFGEPNELKQRFAGQHNKVLRLLEKIDAWKMWVLCDREPIKSWSAGRIGLLGDAAHPMLQYLAQGGCMAIEDAVCLANSLQLKNGDIVAALKSYEESRYLRTARVQLTARFYGDAYHASGPTAELRDLALRARTVEQAYAGMTWLYKGVDNEGRQVLNTN